MKIQQTVWAALRDLQLQKNCWRWKRTMSTAKTKYFDYGSTELN